MGFFYNKKIDFEKHNEETELVWKSFNDGDPIRIPVSVSGSIRSYIQNPQLNVKGYSFEQFFKNADIQIEAQVEYQKYRRFNVLGDHEMGMPKKGWFAYIDYQNSFEAAWMGCPLVYIDGAVPDTLPILAEKKEALYDMPQWIDDNNKFMMQTMEMYEALQHAGKEKEFYGLPLTTDTCLPAEGTDGPFDLAYKLRGADNLLIDMLTDEDYFHDLMTYLTENIIRRMKRYREFRWKRYPDSSDFGVYKTDNFYFADDAIALISKNQYKEYVYPYHKRIFNEFSTGKPAQMHLCGDATRHFKFLKDTFNIKTFDTGFPVNHGALRDELGEDVLIKGGPTIMEVKDGTPESIEKEVKRICESGIMRGGKFVMIAANNLAPFTPVENIEALFNATRKYGKYK